MPWRRFIGHDEGSTATTYGLLSVFLAWATQIWGSLLAVVNEHWQDWLFFIGFLGACLAVGNSAVNTAIRIIRAYRKWRDHKPDEEMWYHRWDKRR